MATSLQIPEPPLVTTEEISNLMWFKIKNALDIHSSNIHTTSHVHVKETVAQRDQSGKLLVTN